jgi:hypothetical protein
VTRKGSRSGWRMNARSESKKPTESMKHSQRRPTSFAHWAREVFQHRAGIQYDHRSSVW